MVEAVREGYLLHYGEPRLIAGHDADLGLLAGDYLYALGLDRLAALGDTEAVAVLSELIARCAQLHAEGREDEVEPLWPWRPAREGGRDSGVEGRIGTGPSRMRLGQAEAAYGMAPDRGGASEVRADAAEDGRDFVGRVGDLPVREAQDAEA